MEEKKVVAAAVLHRRTVTRAGNMMGDRNWTNQLMIIKMGITDFSYDIDKCTVQLYDYLVKEGGKLEEPTDYITIN